MQRMVQFIVNIDSTFLAISVSKGTMLLEKDKWKEDFLLQMKHMVAEPHETYGEKKKK